MSRTRTQQVRHECTYQSDLKTILADLVPQKQAEVKEFRSQHGSNVVGEVTVDMVSMYEYCYMYNTVCVCVCVSPFHSLFSVYCMEKSMLCTCNLTIYNYIVLYILSDITGTIYVGCKVTLLLCIIIIYM